MYRISLLASCLAVFLLHTPCTQAQQCLTSNDNRVPHPDGQRKLYEGQQEFSLALLNAINQLNPDGNLFFSPYSTYHALLLAYFISGNKTEEFLKKTLRLDPKQDKADIFAAYKFDRSYQTFDNKSYEFTSANRIYVTNKVTVRDCIYSRFYDELQPNTNFQENAELVRNGINKWVENKTHDMIKDLLPPGAIDQETSLVLVNAAYFKGVWENKFDPDLTKPGVFYINPEKQTLVDFMHVEGTFNHDVSEVLKAHILELPYKGDDISMYILLPPFLKGGVPETLKALTADRFRSFVDEEQTTLLPKTVKVVLPKFTLEHTIEMVPILESLGVGNLFRFDSDFSALALPPPMSSTPNPRHPISPRPPPGADGRGLKLGAAVHKARISIDENGAEAAAATAFFTFRMMGPEQDEEAVDFVCDRPFGMVVYNRKQKTVLFMGVYRGGK